MGQSPGRLRPQSDLAEQSTEFRVERFMILAHRRTGSNLLVSLLNSHPQLRCFGEVFREQYNFNLYMPELAKEFTDYATRTSNPAKYLQAISEQIDVGTHSWGFKLMAFQLQTEFAELLAEQAVKVIVLSRENQLAQYSSELIAAATGQGIAGQNVEVETAEVHFSAKEFNKFRQKVEDDFHVATHAIRAVGLPCLELEYMELQKEETLNKVCEFLNVGPGKMKSGLQKRNNPAVINRFKNFHFARTYLVNHGLNRWAVEAHSE